MPSETNRRPAQVAITPEACLRHDAANAARRQPGEPSARSARPALEDTENNYLVLDGLGKSYDGVQMAVEGVSLSVARGEFISFLGPSGSGKTTTLMMVAGFEQPDRGSIRLEGRELRAVPPHKRGIGMVFQNYALFPHLTVQKNVEFSLRMRGVDRAERARRAAEALAMVGLEKFGERRPREMSGGQQQRAALARALVFQPEVLLLDEPLGALDKNLREQMQVEIRRIQQQLKITTIYVTHDQSEAMNLSDRIVVFRQGGIEQMGAPLDIYRRPASRFVASFLGDCNLLHGEVVDGATGAVRLEGIGVAALPQAQGMPAGRAVEVMLRPEAARIATDRPGLLRFRLAVDHVSHFGGTAVLSGRLAEQPFRVRLLGSEIPAEPVFEASPADLWILP